VRIPELLLILVGLIAGVLGVAVWLGDVGATPVAHPEYATLLGSGGAHGGAALWLGWAFGALQIAFFGACFALGMRRREGLGPLRRPILIGLLVYEVAWTALILAYARFAADPGGALLLAFPAPTALMLYVLWPLPLLFMWIYLRSFDGWFLDEEELARFRRIVEDAPSEDPSPADTEARRA